MSLHGRKIKRIMNWFGGTWLNLTFALCLAWKILEAMAQTVVGAALLGAAGTAFLASPGSPGPVSQTAPSLRGTAPGNPGSAGGAGVAGTAALASLAGARWWMVGGSGEVGRMWEVLQHDKLTQH